MSSDPILEHQSLHRRLENTRRALLLAASLAVTALGALGALLLRDARSSPPELSPADRSALLRQLVEASPGLYDSHPDPDVARILLPELRQRRLGTVSVTTNSWGLREREWAVPKPVGTTRVVLLGDSFVFGFGVRADQRLGALLEEELGRGLPGSVIEVLHVGVPSWNFRSAGAFLRRHLPTLEPDLVLHLSLPNDIEDTAGVRGFGQLARFSPHAPERADALLEAGHAMRSLGFSRPGYLRHGLDHESRTHFRRALGELERLADALDRRGVPYRLLLHHRELGPVSRRHLGDPLGRQRTRYLAAAFGSDRGFWLTPTDPHWNPAGHRRAADALYELVRREDLLPFDPPSLTEATAAHRSVFERGLEEALVDEDDEALLRRFGRASIASVLDLGQLDESTAAQIHGGIDTEGLVGPVASMILRNPGGRHLRVRGRSLGAPELAGHVVEVSVDGHLVGRLRLPGHGNLAASFAIPEAVRSRPFVTIRFDSSDWVILEQARHCVVFRLESVGLHE